MTDPEIVDWMSLLVDPLRVKPRSRIIKDLLDNANGDGMSNEDRDACRRALNLIKDNPKLDYLHPPLTPFEDVEDGYEH